MDAPVLLRVDGRVARSCLLSFDDLSSFDAAWQIPDVHHLDSSRRGAALRLAGLLQHVEAEPQAAYLGLHSSHDNFHACIPLAPVRDRAVLIYQLDGKPLDRKAGGPVRFFIPNYAACHTAEIDECANVKFLDHLEVMSEKGYDNRPRDDEAHRRLHEQTSE